MSEGLTFTFPMPANLGNGRQHWAVKHREHEAWKTRALLGDRSLRWRRTPLEQVTVSAVFYIGSKPMDDDNAVARLKWCLDFLKERGIITDDSRKHLRLRGIPEQRPGTPRRVVLTVESLA